jgi:hypothetical protein
MFYKFQNLSMSMNPNIFRYATSELSQDAFLCYLAAWADPKYSGPMHELGKSFLNQCMAKHSKQFDSIDSVDVKKQTDSIDVLVAVNKSRAIFIEDKTYTSEHSGQLERYKKRVSELGYSDQCPIYYKPINQADVANVLSAGYMHFTRKEMIDLLDSGIKNKVQDTLVEHYCDFLKQIQNSYELYKELPADKWDSGFFWHGFYSDIQDKLNGLWGYVPKGDFHGFWWNWHGEAGTQQYLQLEEDKLCFKVEFAKKDSDERRKFRWDWHSKIMKAAEQIDFPLLKPHFGNGNTMTVAVYSNDYRTFVDNKIDVDKTLETLHKAEEVLDLAVKF